MPPKGRGKLPTMRRRKIVPTASLRKRLNEERDDPSHPNYNNPPQVPAKRRKTRSIRVPLRDFSISGSLPRVSVIPEEESSSASDSQGESAEDPGTPEIQSNMDCFPYAEDKDLPSTEVQQEENLYNPTIEQQRTATIEDEVFPERNSEQKAGENCPRDPYLLTSFATHRAKALVLGQFPTKKGTDVSVKYLSFFQDQHVSKPWSWGAAILAHLYYNLGASSRVNAKGLACCITLLESWIFEHFPKLPGIPTPSFTKLCPDVVNFGKDADYDGAKVLGASSGISQRENDEVSQNQNEGGGGPAEVVEDPARSVLVQALEAKTSECAFLMEATGRMQADIEAKNLANSICEKKLNEKKLLKDMALECESTKKILEDQRLERESNKKLVEDLSMQLTAKVNATETLGKINDKLMDEVYVHQTEVPLPLNIVPHPEESVGEATMWKQKYEELYAKLEEAQRRLSEIGRNGVWRLALKGAIEGGDFEDPEDSTYKELGRQFTKLLTIAQEGPKGNTKMT
ncbi:hypothetical protein GIB67_010069 [Kingdonia uniflora]|uniref:Aminotransferase-like plant mobile domain-containing protein n=1 Tax=Kingdonia uniflora TaxID=39325 RepID=A0A7J7PAY2_9MAGN|nr:hypothetical protein GIB67_010069 [Kingdonia uniflora]